LIGTETLALVFTWTLLLLAEYPEWQECAWAEILEVCGHNINNFNASMLTKMKIVRGFLSYLYFNAYNLLLFYGQVGCGVNTRTLMLPCFPRLSGKMHRIEINCEQ
jgi:hypothetical protein